ncbi:MAG: ectoine/hydroxyectoine ABC transporter ATP-binding protein EhuA [Deltaproteobacteria bacterium]|nr:ectoine/hydroxyectoine ABC transporter ATP-binding protein EhuA [Deltaproteobacteria bacterium]
MTGIKKSFKGTEVLRGVDLVVPAGRKVTFIGPSGSGKSTLLRILMTLERPDGGAVEIGGEPVWTVRGGGGERPASAEHLHRIRRKVGMVFQHFHLFPHMTALGNVSAAPRMALGLSRADAEDRGRRLLDRVGLADKAGAYPAKLSGGQKQRVAIARALAMDPEIMLFDEVTSALDPELVGEAVNVLLELADEGRMTMLVVTHQMNFAQAIADEVHFLDDGRIIESGSPDRIFREPSEERTKKFLDSVLAYR